MNIRLVRREELKGIIPYREAISVVETAFREWEKNPVFNNPRRTTHTPALTYIQRQTCFTEHSL
jgi:hypothetical protein